MITWLCHFCSIWKMLSFWICWTRCLAWVHHQIGQLGMAPCLHCRPCQCTAHPWFASLHYFLLLSNIILKMLLTMIRYGFFSQNYYVVIVLSILTSAFFFGTVPYPWNCNQGNWKTSSLSGPKWCKLKNCIRTFSITCFGFARWI